MCMYLHVFLYTYFKNKLAKKGYKTTAAFAADVRQVSYHTRASRILCRGVLFYNIYIHTLYVYVYTNVCIDMEELLKV